MQHKLDEFLTKDINASIFFPHIPVQIYLERLSPEIGYRYLLSGLNPIALCPF